MFAFITFKIMNRILQSSMWAEWKMLVLVTCLVYKFLSTATSIKHNSEYIYNLSYQCLHLVYFQQEFLKGHSRFRRASPSLLQ